MASPASVFPQHLKQSGAVPAIGVAPANDLPQNRVWQHLVVHYLSSRDVLMVRRVPMSRPVTTRAVSDFVVLYKDASQQSLTVGVEIHRASKLVNALHDLYPKNFAFEGGFPIAPILQMARYVAQGIDDVAAEIRGMYGKAHFVVEGVCIPEEEMLALLRHDSKRR